MDPATGFLYQVREIDYERENEFELQLEARQNDNPVKVAHATVRNPAFLVVCSFGHARSCLGR